MKATIEAGLVFAIPILNGRFGFGQLVMRQDPIFYMVAYDIEAQSPTIDDPTLRQARAVLMGNFFDILIRNGRWTPIQHFTAPTVPYPCFKIRIGDTFYVESWDRQRKREATPQELTHLQPPSNYGPIILENALNAYFGLSPWECTFEPLKVEAVAAISQLC
jgi:hypothetical protein